MECIMDIHNCFYIMELWCNIFLNQYCLPPTLLRYRYHVQIITTYFKKEQTVLIHAKYNHEFMKEIYLPSFKRFSMTFLNDINFFFVKNEKNQ